jgi:hypothetical protein
MDETQTLAAQALRELLDNPDRDDWDELLAANRALIKAMETGAPMTQNNARIIAEYLREAGWRERAIGAATKPGPDLESSGGPDRAGIPAAVVMRFRLCPRVEKHDGIVAGCRTIHAALENRVPTSRPFDGAF